MTRAKARRRAVIARERAAIQAAVDPWNLIVSPEARDAERPRNDSSRSTDPARPPE